MLSGAQLSCADATEGEAVRVAMFTRLLDYRAALGITPEILDGLDTLGHHYADVFGGIAVVGTRPGAYERLEAAGLTPHRFVLCGPAVAVSDAPGAPARVAPGEWELDTDGDRIVVSNQQEARHDVRPHADCTARSGRRRRIHLGDAMTRALISADNHVFEPFTLWQDRLPEQYRQRGPASNMTASGA